jgi:hypothetical protein
VLLENQLSRLYSEPSIERKSLSRTVTTDGVSSERKADSPIYWKRVSSYKKRMDLLESRCVRPRQVRYQITLRRGHLPGRATRYLQLLSMLRRLDDRIKELCAKVVATRASPELDEILLRLVTGHPSEGS